MTDDYEFPYSSENMSDEELKIWDELYQLPLIKLIEEFDKVMDGDSIKDSVRYDIIRGMIADKLGLIHRDMFGPVFATELDKIDDRISTLESKFKSHRHDVSKAFSSKPEW
jgi:hypothetical protein